MLTLEIQRRPVIRAALAVSLLGVLLGGCGGERTFDAKEFVSEAREAGATIELGQPLYTDDASKKAYGVTLGEEPDEEEDEHRTEPENAGRSEGSEQGREPEAHDHGDGPTAGTLIVHADSDGAQEQIRRCRGSASLVCYRAANVTVSVDSAVAKKEDLDRFVAALRRMSGE